ncbi:enoyl-CoA hydratase/isomerase family protein [Cognatishimia activa]|uniref:Carnitinyl-CoA dehydratase n=1 Tax=Cognatishimia activa TaxID=1715691 RepID=A0A0P1IT48_9RHOB|nr:enoyl-CoA hydratase/isomerase family protein [Cognatishimia activa]CUI72481.1 Carnitinyl-CoA dehydratase [Cognatishimia activa]CUK26623.1 Carnitinyl-CoA dehydratase [Cognatishimia activa]
MAIIEYQVQGKVAVVTMNNAENKQNPEFARQMLAALDQAEADKSVKAMVITSSDEKNWSQGVDLGFLNAALKEQRHDDIKAFMYGMNEVFSRLLLAPFPVIAAINGHAFGNGAMLACACDFRFMRSDRGYFCFPEVDISIPFLPGMIAFVKTAVPYYRFNEMKLTGRRVGAPELQDDHIIELACVDAEDTFAKAMEFAGTFNKARGIFGEHKRRLHKHILEVMEAEDKPLIESLQLMA